MISPFAACEAKDTAKEISEFNRKLIKGFQTLVDIGEVDVGTSPKDLIYQEDKIKLYHYKRKGKPTCSIPVLIVYALVNRPYMLDLQPDKSLIRNLLEKGMDIYLIDWGYPTRSDRYISLSDYINVYMNNCVNFIRMSTKKAKINLMGVCQGGTFSVVYAALNPEKVKNLITLVTPIDFSTKEGLLFSWSKHINIDALVDTYGVVPGDFLNQGFLMLKPFMLNISKYVNMFSIMEDRESLLSFLRMEKWIFDSPAQAGEALRSFIKDFYQQNKLVKGELKIGRKEVDLKKITMPLLNIYASSDHIVPPNSSKPLNELVESKDKELYEFKGGHIGVFVGSKSQKELTPTISEWLHRRTNDRINKKSSKRKNILEWNI